MGRRVDPDALEKKKKKKKKKKRNFPLVFATQASHSDCLMRHKVFSQETEVGTDRFLCYKIRFW